MEIRQLRSFVKLAEHLHFGHAAVALSISQPALSQQIQKLERDMGHHLFIRRVGSIELTVAGQALLPRAREVLRTVSLCYEAQAPDTTCDLPTVRIAYPVSASDLLTRMALTDLSSCASHLRTVLLEGSSAEALARLKNGDADVALAWLPLRLPDPDIESFDVFSVELQVVLSRAHRLAQKESLSVEDLQDDSLILFDRNLNPALYDEICACIRPARGAIFHSGRGVRSSETTYAAAGMGFALSAPEIDASVTSNPAVALVPLRGNPLQLHLALHYASWNVSPAIRCFVNFMHGRRTSEAFIGAAPLVPRPASWALHEGPDRSDTEVSSSTAKIPSDRDCVVQE